MGLQPFHITMQAKRDVPPPPLASAVPAMFEALLGVFAPFAVTLKIDDGDLLEIARLDAQRTFGTTPLWCDEELTRAPLTSCKPDLGADVIAELYDRLANVTPRWLYASAEGALFHRFADEPAWYGRWRLDQTLHELVSVAFTWTADPLRGFEMSCPLSGYPLTSMRPLHRPQLGDGDPAISRQNRELLGPALCGVRAALGFDREEVEWSIEGHCFEARDRADLANRWLPALRAS